jgi:SAM-dependent methyltransferase|tara:strand:- start:68 stop:805 length:738 start_codon:yes stop_codon:yes gene_type:complete
MINKIIRKFKKIFINEKEKNVSKNYLSRSYQIKKANMKKINYKYYPRHIPFMKEQIWEAKDNLKIYNNQAIHEFRQIINYIDKPKKILELGCGLGRGSIYLNNILNYKKKQFYLMDRTGYTFNSGDYNPTKDEYYNDLFLTKEFSELNGIKKPIVLDTEINNWKKLPKFDLIFSFCSFGFHVPIERYMNKILKLTDSKTTLIFGVRGNYYNHTSFSKYFKKVLYKQGVPSKNYTLQNWLILKEKI